MIQRSKRRRGNPKQKEHDDESPPTSRQPKDLKRIDPRNESQAQYLTAIENNIITLGIGVAGTGKTFLAVYEALKYHWSKDIKRIIITRPAIEAGEKLGFLPGDIKDKVDPYMRPIYDAFFDLMGLTLTQEKIERGYIEIAPLAFCRGRTFSNCFIILDEAQNATLEQLKMITTRVGENCKLVITGDPKQTDLPRGKEAGLNTLKEILTGVEDVGIVEFGSDDVIRSKIVANVVKAFERYENENK